MVQYHVYWGSGSLHQQDISCHFINCAGKPGPCLPWQSSTWQDFNYLRHLTVEKLVNANTVLYFLQKWSGLSWCHWHPDLLSIVLLSPFSPAAGVWVHLQHMYNANFISVVVSRVHSGDCTTTPLHCTLHTKHAEPINLNSLLNRLLQVRP